MADKKTCFIIMPISTPEGHVETYRDGAEHFRHVLQCLFLPAVEKAGYEAIPPVAKGADLIHAEIIRNLEGADLVLCDMSCLNPNVLFEFGIRTALNKPVCVVKDEHTRRVPFDTAILNHHEYKSTLEPWELEGETAVLVAHLTESATRSVGGNALWRYFGLKTQARPAEGTSADSDKLDFLVAQVASLRQSLAEHRNALIHEEFSLASPLMLRSQIEAALRDVGLSEVGVEVVGVMTDGEVVLARFDPTPSRQDFERVRGAMQRMFDRQLVMVDLAGRVG